MNAVDTDIVVHFLVDDDASQMARARALIERGDIFVCMTVILESEWVLRSVYGRSAEAIGKALRSLCGLSQVKVENEQVLTRALDWMDRGMDFADALHLATCAERGAFATFDKDLVRLAKRLDIAGVTLT